MVVVVPQMHQERKPCDGSFIRISSAKLKEMANQTLENIKLYKAHDRKRLASRERKEFLERQEKKRNSIWSKLFGYKEVPVPTDEEFIKLHGGKGGGDTIWLPETFWIDFRYSKNAEVAHRLLLAAEHADEVAVSTKDLERLI